MVHQALVSFLIAVVGASVVIADVGSGKATTLRMNDGRDIPVLGLGTWLQGGSSKDVQKGVETAIAAGYRHIDTAAIYDTEKEVGKGVQAKIDDGTIRREDIFITTKLWNDNHAVEKVIPALKNSLTNLGMDYVDLYLIHWPVSFGPNGTFDSLDYVDTWKSMEEAQRLGLAKSIGVSNFNEKQLERLLKSAKVKPVVNQVEVNPNFTQKKLHNFCKERDIVVVAYTPLGSMPEPKSKDKDSPAPKLDDPILKAMGDKYHKNTVQIVLRYLIERGLVPIPKSVTPSRIQQNIDVFDFKLTPEEVEKVDDFNLDKRIVTPATWKDSPHYPFSE